MNKDRISDVPPGSSGPSVSGRHGNPAAEGDRRGGAAWVAGGGETEAQKRKEFV